MTKPVTPSGVHGWNHVWILRAVQQWRWVLCFSFEGIPYGVIEKINVVIKHMFESVSSVSVINDAGNMLIRFLKN